MRRTIATMNEGHSTPVLPPIRLHDLRHVHATLLLQAGIPVHVVAARLGHADPAITLRVYAHGLRDQAIEVAQIFASVVDHPEFSGELLLANPLASHAASSTAAEPAGR